MARRKQHLAGLRLRTCHRRRSVCCPLHNNDRAMLSRFRTTAVAGVSGTGRAIINRTATVAHQGSVESCHYHSPGQGGMVAPKVRRTLSRQQSSDGLGHGLKRQTEAPTTGSAHTIQGRCRAPESYSRIRIPVVWCLDSRTLDSRVSASERRSSALASAAVSSLRIPSSSPLVEANSPGGVSMEQTA